jgi:hypothetical protein
MHDTAMLLGLLADQITTSPPKSLPNPSVVQAPVSSTPFSLFDLYGRASLRAA